MLASTIRFSNHYQTPPHTRQQYCQQRVGLGPVEPHVVIPGPNSVLALSATPHHRHPRHITPTTLVGRATNVMFHP